MEVQQLMDAYFVVDLSLVICRMISSQYIYQARAQRTISSLQPMCIHFGFATRGLEYGQGKLEIQIFGHADLTFTIGGSLA
jgi:hypothetical protein